MRHRFGVESPEAHAAMARLDARVGRIVQAVRRAGLEEETIFCIVSDHGQQDAPHGVLLDAALRKACGARAQSLGMGAYIFGPDLAAARRALEENAEAWRVAHIYSAQELRALGAPREVSLAVDAAEGVCFLDEWEQTHGEHGFSLNCPQARTLLLLAGGPFRAEAALPQADLVDIAPTLARALGLSHAQGRALDAAFRE